MDDGAVIQQGTPLVIGSHEIPRFDCEALKVALKTDQAGKSTFPEFLQSAWKAGVVGYDVDFTARKVTYYGVNNEIYTEEYPYSDIKPD
jgi:uncharacterized protein YbcV (DUF1398 family)